MEQAVETGLKKKKIVTFGGGHGHAQILKALKMLPVEIVAICGNSDSGGKTEEARRHHGGNRYLGDLTRCIAALCTDDTLAAALNYRFKGRYKSSKLNDYSLRHVMMLAFEAVSNSPIWAHERMRQYCGIMPHRVVPVTTEPMRLHFKVSGLGWKSGESKLDTIARMRGWDAKRHRVEKVVLRPRVTISARVSQYIREAEYCIICPGDFYSSITPVLLPRGLAETFETAHHMKIIFFLNIMTKQGETHLHTAHDFLVKIKKLIGRSPDHVVLDSSELDPGVLERYRPDEKILLTQANKRVDLDLAKRLVSAELAGTDEEGRIVHDPRKVGILLHRLLGFQAEEERREAERQEKERLAAIELANSLVSSGPDKPVIIPDEVKVADGVPREAAAVLGLVS